MEKRRYNPIDRLINNLDQAIHTLFGKPDISERPYPAINIEESEMDASKISHVSGLMRINHTGEVCAQALYQGQAMTARLTHVRENMERAALEENDHLDWCNNRLQELGGHTSYLNPLWYLGSFTLGATAGLVGDKWSLGFVAETEKQVVKHLENHLQKIPENDQRSRAILEQMKIDEERHGTMALNAGGMELPEPVKKLMGLTSKVMTTLAYKI
ncbi:MAG TPA: 2-polyprenyl-3-methyl-6-methoxy-1,4-benzoquinone monooxygenase [Gammaproteobacteria bacterium]|nr:2-polyprenyl-3-methyl-6-methoxy-1,4-benzoquinone monooxygenase [Gammaproteobacteria bacterium]